jgi:hypothetical protein
LSQGDIVNIFTKYTYNYDVLVFRATHPNFQNGGSWYGWAVVKFQDESLVGGYYDNCLYPTKLLAFIEHIRLVNSEITKETCCDIVHSCNESDHTQPRDSLLTETWTSQFDEENNPVLNIVPLLSIDVCLLVIAESPKLAEKR